MRFSCALALALLLPTAAWAADDEVQRWLASEPARAFRARVVELALIYGESSGIDPRGYKVEARTARPLVQGCAEVEVVTSNAGEAVQREVVEGCRHK